MFPAVRLSSGAGGRAAYRGTGHCLCSLLPGAALDRRAFTGADGTEGRWGKACASVRPPGRPSAGRTGQGCAWQGRPRSLPLPLARAKEPAGLWPPGSHLTPFPPSLSAGLGFFPFLTDRFGEGGDPPSLALLYPEREGLSQASHLPSLGVRSALTWSLSLRVQAAAGVFSLSVECYLQTVTSKVKGGKTAV